MKMISVFLLVLAALLAAVGQVFFKIGANGNTSWSSYLSMPIFFGAFSYIVGTVIWVYVLSYEKLVDVYVFSGFSFVFVYLAGVFFLNEKVELLGLAGVGLVIFGVSLVVLSGSK